MGDPATVPKVLVAMERLWGQFSAAEQAENCESWDPAEMADFTETMFASRDPEVVAAVQDFVALRCGWSAS